MIEAQTLFIFVTFSDLHCPVVSKPEVETNLDLLLNYSNLLFRQPQYHFSLHFLPVHLSVAFSVNAKLGTALEALQLCLKLLPHSCREELRRLLTFMSLAADPQGIKLDKEVRHTQLVTTSYVGKCIIQYSIFIF